MKTSPDFYKKILLDNGYRLTEGRLELLKFLDSYGSPVTVPTIEEKAGLLMNRVTLYRALEDFVQKGIVAEVLLPGKAAHYELIHEHDHHHHIICKTCGKIEDVHIHEEGLLKEAAKHSQSFKTITSHSLEFFGICTSCEKA